MYQKFKLILLLCLIVRCSTKRSRSGRQLDLDAIIEGRLSNHVIGERQSRMLADQSAISNSTSNSTDLNVTNSTSDLPANKTAKLLDEDATMHKHSSFVSHYANEDELSKSEELKKSIESLEQLLGTSARVVNSADQNNNAGYPQASSIVPISYLNPVYPTEDKILAALINQAATNMVNSQQTGDLSTAHSNPSPIYASSADRPTGLGNPNHANPSSSGGLSAFLGNLGANTNTNKRNPFASIGSSIQEFAASMFPNRITNKFIKRKQSGQSVGQNQIDFASFASECSCVPFYMCRNGYIEQNSIKPNQQSSPINKFGGAYEPSVVDLIENSGSSQFNKYYDPTQLSGIMMNNEEMQAFQKELQKQDMQMAASFIQSNGYPSAGILQQKDAKQENVGQSLPIPQPLKIDKRSQLSTDDTSVGGLKAQETKNTNLELPIDERSIDGSKIDLTNQTEAVLEVSAHKVHDSN